MNNTPKLPQLISVPDDFLFTWPEPGDAEQLWQQDPAHFPNQITPLDFEISITVMDDGYTKAAQAYDIPIAIIDRLINTYYYVAYVNKSSPPEEKVAQTERSEKKLQETIENLNDLWHKSWLPEIKQHLEYWETFDLTNTSMPALVEHLAETQRRLNRLWEVHFLLVLPMLLSISLFDELYQELFPDANTAEGYELLAGFDNHTMRSGLALWEISRKVMTLPAAHKILTTTPASEVMAQLANFEEGKLVLVELHDFLSKYGKRSNSLDLTVPTWLEDPTPVIKNLQDYLNQSDKDLLADVKAIVIQREKRLAQARAVLKDYPKPVVKLFETRLAQAQTAYILRDDHSYWMDSQSCFYARQVVLEFGRRLTRMALIDHEEEVFFLTVAELKEVATNGLMSVELSQLLKARQEEMRKYKSVEPPKMLGTIPDASPSDDPIMTMIFKLEGTPTSSSELPNEIKGQGASPGIVRGTVRVVRNPSEIDKLKPGDILVAKTTTSSWSPLFAFINGVVTDVGGVLSHCAVIAREYGIPAVVGTDIGTTTLQDGQIIELNGNNGLVRMITVDQSKYGITMGGTEDKKGGINSFEMKNGLTYSVYQEDWNLQSDYFLDMYVYHLSSIIEDMRQAGHPPKKVLELALGRGSISIGAALLTDDDTRLVGCDLEPQVAPLVYQNATKNGVRHKIEVRIGDLFEPVQAGETFDLLLFEIPFAPMEPQVEQDYLEQGYVAEVHYISGGPDGRKFIDKIISQANEILNPGGYVVWVQPSYIGVQKSLDLLDQYGFTGEVFAEKEWLLQDTKYTLEHKSYIEEACNYIFPKNKAGEDIFYLTIIKGVKR